MRRFQFKTNFFVVIVLMAALNAAGVRAATLDHRGPVGFFMGLGCLPMANILAAGLLVGICHSRSRLFLIGFQAFGAVSMIFYSSAILALRPTTLQWLVWLYLEPAYAMLPSSPARSNIDVILGCCFFALWTTLPQVAFALIGGLLTRKPGVNYHNARRRDKRYGGKGT